MESNFRSDFYFIMFFWLSVIMNMFLVIYGKFYSDQNRDYASRLGRKEIKRVPLHKMIKPVVRSIASVVSSIWFIVYLSLRFFRYINYKLMISYRLKYLLVFRKIDNWLIMVAVFMFVQMQIKHKSNP